MEFSDTAIIIIAMVVVSIQTCQYSSDKYLEFDQKSEVKTGDLFLELHSMQVKNTDFIRFNDISFLKKCHHLNFGISLVHPTVKTYLNVKLIYFYFIFITYFTQVFHISSWH
jgi:hypothetical protein